MENGEIALEDAIAAFQKGMVLSKNSKRRWTRLKRPWLRSCKKTEQKVILNEEARKISSCRVGLGRLFMETNGFASSLRESVLYSIHAGGKRIRPFSC